MKTAQEILIESKTSNLHEDEEARKWARIVRDSRGWLVLDFIALLLWPVMVAVLVYAQPTHRFTPYYGLAIVFWLTAAFRLILTHRRRERALRDAIRLHAPELHSKFSRG